MILSCYKDDTWRLVEWSLRLADDVTQLPTMWQLSRLLSSSGLWNCWNDATVRCTVLWVTTEQVAPRELLTPGADVLTPAGDVVYGAVLVHTRVMPDDDSERGGIGTNCRMCMLVPLRFIIVGIVSWTNCPLHTVTDAAACVVVVQLLLADTRPFDGCSSVEHWAAVNDVWQDCLTDACERCWPAVEMCVLLTHVSDDELGTAAAARHCTSDDTVFRFTLSTGTDTADTAPEFLITASHLSVAGNLAGWQLEFVSVCNLWCFFCKRSSWLHRQNNQSNCDSVIHCQHKIHWPYCRGFHTMPMSVTISMYVHMPFSHKTPTKTQKDISRRSVSTGVNRYIYIISTNRYLNFKLSLSVLIIACWCKKDV